MNIFIKVQYLLYAAGNRLMLHHNKHFLNLKMQS